MLRALLVFILMIGQPVCAVSSDQVITFTSLARETSDHIRDILAWRDELPPASLSVSSLLSHDDLSRLYEAREFTPLWQVSGDLKPAAGKLIEWLRAAGEQGLCPEAYLLDKLEGLIKIHNDFARHGIDLAPNNRALLDLFLSQAFLTYATHLVEGQVDPALAHVDWRARRRKADLVKLLNYAVENDRVDQVLSDLLPPHRAYQQMTGALEVYRVITATGGWPSLPEGPSIRPGKPDERLPALRERLAMTGDLAGEIPNETVYDKITRAAVKRFQRRHGLVEDGIVGKKTLAALNVPAAGRVRQLELNLERWRWQPKTFGRRHLVINIADFSLTLVEGGKTVMSMPVIVGTLYRKTPVFSARMTYLEFAPYWTVPPTILREDKLPKIRANPGYLAKNHYRILRMVNGELQQVDPWAIPWDKVEAEDFPGILRMEPGPWNPLGRVKFMFPNGFNVYLHDTNEPELFRQGVRSFSSGCIRAKRPVDLAQYLLVETGNIDCDRLLDLLEGDVPQKVKIKPLPVHIQYWTAWVDMSGVVHFRDDVYYRDLDLETSLGQPEYRVSDQLLVSSGVIQAGKIQ